ncbi:MAG: cobaltochelatase subunit CobN [Rhizobiaceae bacterium]|jgi:hypothetical protein
MYLLATTMASLETLIKPVDLAQEPASIVALFFSDRYLAGIAAAWRESRDHLVVRLLGGNEWWQYGCERLPRLARQNGMALAIVPGAVLSSECRERDEFLFALSTIPAQIYHAMLACFWHSGRENLTLALEQAASAFGLLSGITAASAEPIAQAGFYLPGQGIAQVDEVEAIMLASDVAPIDALVAALGARHIAAVPVFVQSLRDSSIEALLVGLATELPVQALVTTVAFAMDTGECSGTIFRRLVKVAMATTRDEAWQTGQRGLTSSDFAMHVILPELDGFVTFSAISVKDARTKDDDLSPRLQVNLSEPSCAEVAADRLASWLWLAAALVGERRIGIIISDYPAATGRAGYADGLDMPQSVVELLMRMLECAPPALPLAGAAQQHGNGLLEVTSWANLQIRGLTIGSASAFADAVAALGVDTEEAPEIRTSPFVALVGERGAILLDMAARLRATLNIGCFAGLSPKFAVVVEDASRADPALHRPDLRLSLAEACGLWDIAVAGDAASTSRIGTADTETANSADDPCLAFDTCADAPAYVSAYLSTQEMSRCAEKVSVIRGGLWLYVAGCQIQCAWPAASHAAVTGILNGVEIASNSLDMPGCKTAHLCALAGQFSFMRSATV